MIRDYLVGKQVIIIASFKDDSGISLLNDRGLVVDIEEDNYVTVNAFYYRKNKKINRFVNIPSECVEIIGA